MSEVLVLCYHAVSPKWAADLAVTPDALKSQLSHLLEQGWHGATFSQAVLDPPAQRTLVVTFDDGFLSVAEHAAPILGALGIPATVFAPTAFMHTRQPLRWPGIEQWQGTDFAGELECMCWNDLARLVDLGWEVGSHTRTHPRLTQLDDQRLVDELGRSRDECAERLRSCDSIAYPYGDVDERVAGFAAGVGYRCGASLARSLAPLGTHQWPRVGIYNHDHAARFRLKVNRSLRRSRVLALRHRRKARPS